jgi:HD domain
MAKNVSLNERADALEQKMSDELDVLLSKSALFNMADGKLGASNAGSDLAARQGKYYLMGDDPRLPRMPAKPTLADFFDYRAKGINHLLQSATHALKASMPEKTILACLLHDISNAIFIKSDHGYWGAQLVEPYVDEEVSWAIRYHQALRFYPDESVGYKYPESYVKLFGEDYKPEPYIERDYRYARDHKWYMSARLICVNDLYAFDPNVQVELEEFTDIVGRHFRQPKDGLGFDASPSAHMWRTIMWPTKYL